ncbi:MAG: hypothetical protein IJ995_05770 [Clostridia bacterium]|nr:hypothetical protein [Clostridia bacterium]
MRTFFITILILLLSALVLWGINAAAAGTHSVMGDAGYKPFIQEIFQ